MAKILVLDDERIYAEEVADTLGRAGHDVWWTSDWADGIRRCSWEPPDILVVDWMLRDNATGLEVAEAGKFFSPRLKAITISGFDPDYLKKFEVTPFVSAWLCKPFEADTLRTTVRRVLAEADHVMPVLPVGVLWTNSRGTVTRLNPFAEKFLGVGDYSINAATICEVMTAAGYESLSHVRESAEVKASSGGWYVRVNELTPAGEQLWMFGRSEGLAQREAAVVRVLLAAFGYLPPEQLALSAGDGSRQFINADIQIPGAAERA